MNTVVSVVGPFCAGKTTFLEALQRKFLGKTKAELVFPGVTKADRKMLVEKRNEALENKVKMFNFLVRFIQNRAKRIRSAFQGLEARQFLFVEMSVEYMETLVEAAKNVKLISIDQWKCLRTMLDELHPVTMTDVFVLFGNDEYEVCSNFHKGSGWIEHRQGSRLQRWNSEIESLHAGWMHRQRARGKVVVEINARISKYTRGLRGKKLLNVVFSYANARNGTEFQLFPTAAAARAAAIVRVRLGGTHQQPAVRIRPLDLNAIMPPRRRSATETSGTMMEELTAEGLDEEAVTFQLQVKRMKELHEENARRMAREGPQSPRMGEASGSRIRGPVRAIPGPQLDLGEMGGQDSAEVWMRQPKKKVAEAKRALEKKKLLKRLAELEQEDDEEEVFSPSRQMRMPVPGQARSEKRKRDLGGEGYRKKEKVFGRREQERMEDANLRKEMQEATSRMLASAHEGGRSGSEGIMFVGGRSSKSETLSEDESVSSDKSDDDSDIEEKKKEVRRRNEEKAVKRRKLMKKSSFLASSSTNYGPPDYSGQEESSALSYVPGGQRMKKTLRFNLAPAPEESEMDLGGGASYHDYESDGDYEEGEEYDREEETWSPPEYDEEDSYEEDRHEEMSENVEESRLASSRREEGQAHSDEKEVEEITTTSSRRPPGPAETGKQGGSHKVKRKSSEKAEKEKAKESKEKKEVKEKEKDSKEGETFVEPKEPVRKAPRKIVKVSPTEAGDRTEMAKKKPVITKEEMAAAVANIKVEKTTPPPLTNTMKSNDLKNILLSEANEELDFEMDVPGDKVVIISC